MKVKGQLNSHDSQNPIKQKDMDFKIIGMIFLDIINILGYKIFENNIIRKVKNHNPSKGEKGHSKGEKGRQG